MEESTWLLAFRYPDMDAAGVAYEPCRDLIFRLDIDASAYRIQLNGVAHVVVLGEGPFPPELRETFEGICAEGTIADLPNDVTVALVERRKTTKIPGAFWERRSL